MPSFEAILFAAVFLLLAAGGLSLLLVLRARSGSNVIARFEEGDFRSALEAAAATGETDRDETLAAGRAARHLGDLDRSGKLLDALLADDPDDGEAWLERALTSAYARDASGARAAFDRVSRSRSDLLEPLTLHRAWVELFAGDRVLAARLFDDVETTLETKLRTDLGAGDPSFAEWFLHAGWLWRSRGDEDRATWALDAARRGAPGSLLPEILESWWSEVSSGSKAAR